MFDIQNTTDAFKWYISSKDDCYANLIVCFSPWYLQQWQSTFNFILWHQNVVGKGNNLSTPLHSSVLLPTPMCQGHALYCVI